MGEALTSRFLMMAPREAVQTYQLCVQSDRFEEVIMRELARAEVQAAAHTTAVIDLLWFVWLADQKELVLAGMIPNRKVTDGTANGERVHGW